MRRPESGFRYAILATDIVVFAVKDRLLNVLLVKVKKEYFKGAWAVPGGLVRPVETVEMCAKRNLLKAARADDVFLEQLYTFGEIDRDPHGRVVSVTYYALLPDWERKFDWSGDYDSIEWFPLDQLPKLAYDHNEVIRFAVERLRSKVTYSNIIFSLLPKRFTLSELQRVYEIVLDRKLDKRNFRKKLISSNQLNKTGDKTIGKAHRPADLYRFKQRKYTPIQIL